MNKFSGEVCEKIGYYVYRLVDPRNAETFYVGKGKDNRVFAHVNYALKRENFDEYRQDNEDDVSLKVKRINDIHAAGFDVIHIIHRWGIETNKQALLVEAAVMDCYAGLTNIQSGYNVDGAMIRAESLEKSFAREEFNEPCDKKFIIIKIKQSVIDQRGGSIYETVRSAWKIDKDKAKKYPYVLAVKDGIVMEVYHNVKWKDCTEREGRCEFDAEVAPEDIQKIFKDKRIPNKYIKKGSSNPIRYNK